MAEVRVVLKADGSGLTGTLRMTSAELDGLQRELAATSTATRRTTKEFDDNAAAARRCARAVDEIGVSSNRVQQQNRGLVSSFNTVRNTVAALGVAFAGRQILDAGLALDRIERGLNATAGSSRAAASEMAFLRSESERIGVVFRDVAQGYVMITASAQGTNLQGKATREIFTAITEASRVYNLTQEATMGTMNALSQMIGKGTVSMEELRQQLGDRLPGAMQIAARAMNMTVGQLVAMVSEGKLASDVFLPRFAAELRKTTAASIELAAASPAAEFARLKNAMFELLATVADSGALEAAAGAARRLSASIKDLADSGAAETAGEALALLVDHLDALIVAATTVAGARGLVLLSAGFRRLATDIALTATPLASFATATSVAATRMAVMQTAGARLFAMVGGWPTVIAAAVGGLYLLSEAVQRTGEEAQRQAAAARAESLRVQQEYNRSRSQARQENPNLIVSDIQSLEQSMRGLDKGSALYRSMAGEVRVLREELGAAAAQNERYNSTLTGQREAIDGVLESMRKQLVNQREQIIRTKEGETAVMRHRLEQLQATAATKEQRAEAAMLLRELTATEGELKQLTAGRKTDTEATREAARAGEEYANLVARLTDQLDPLNEAQREHAEIEEQLVQWRAAGVISLAEYNRAIGLNTQALKANNAERKKQLDDSERRFIDQGYQAQEQSEEELNRMREEIALLKLSGIEREKLIDFFDAERYAMNLSGIEREKAIRQFMRLRGEMRDAAIDSNLAEEWAANWKEAIQSVFSTFINALKGGASFGDALKQSIQGALDGVLDKHIKKFSEALGQWASGGGTGGLTARGANGMSVGATGALAVLGSIGQNYIGAESTGASALGGAAYGASIGMVAGPIGAAIGAIIGAVVGAISSQKPYLEVSSSASNINRGRVEGTANSAFGNIYVGKDDLTLPGNMSSQELADNIAKFDDTIAKLLNATEVEAARQALARFDVNQSGGNNIDPEKILEQRLRAVINAVEPEFARFLNGITDIQERVETFTALREMRTMIEDFGQVVDRLSLDPLVTLQNALQTLDDNANEAVESLYAALDAKDIKGAAAALGQAQQALVNQYQQQITLVQQLRQQLIALADAERGFRLEMAQRINANGGNISIAGMVGADLPGLQAAVTNEANTERAMANLNRFITAVDQWLAASIGEIQAVAAAARERVAASLAALDVEEAGIMANAQAAMNAAQQAAQGAADAARAALEAERARLQRELQVAQAFTSVLQTAETLLANLRLSSANPLAESARAAMLERDIEAARASYGSATGEERAAAAQRLLELLQQRMQFAQSLNQRPSEDYLRIYNATVAETAALRSEAQAQADRARQLQEELNALQSANVDATNNVANVIDYVSSADRQRLTEIETERTRLQNELAEINRKESEDIAAARAEARGYYEWAQTVGEDLYERRHQELLAQVNAITGGREIDVFIAEQTAAVQERLREIRDRLDAFLAGISTVPGGTNPGTPPGDGGIRPRVPGDPGVEPVRAGAVAAPVTQTISIVVQSSGNAQVDGETILRVIEKNSPRLRRVLAS